MDNTLMPAKTNRESGFITMIVMIVVIVVTVVVVAYMQVAKVNK